MIIASDRIRYLFHRNFRVLDGKGEAFSGDIEHIENHGNTAPVLSSVDGPDHLREGFSLTDHLFLAVPADDGKFSLLHDAVVHDGMMVPAELLPGGELIADADEFRPSFRVIRQFGSVPAPARAEQLGGLDPGRVGFFLVAHI